uniref:Uncharacterized protein n=1 Tax=Trypanosoma congolense (strain IL3000) TaxID=1068625 RepID=G0UVI3_TRYCI|nr:conserved hypothetical protein [Trypanosoma congolense IL3000]
MVERGNNIVFATKTDEVRLLAIAGDRVGAVYAAHKLVEDSLAKLPAVLADTKKYQPASADPWAAVPAAVDSLCEDVKLCLQLFSVGARVDRSRGLPTVAILYNQQESPAGCLRSFFAVVRDAFTSKGVATPLPPPLMLKFAETIRPFDVSQAADWLQCSCEEMLHRITGVLDNSATHQEEPDKGMVNTGVTTLSKEEQCAVSAAVANGNSPTTIRDAEVTQDVVITMLTLLVRLRAESGEPSGWIQERREKLCLLVGEGALASLIQYESESAGIVIRKKQRLQETVERRNLKKHNKRAPVTEAALEPVTHSIASDEGMSFMDRLRNYVQRITTDWRESPTRIVYLIVAVILLCFLLRRASSLVSAFGEVSRGAPRGGRKLISL